MAMIVDARMMNRRLVGALHVEAMLLADEARSYFDREGRSDRDALPPELRVAFSCESLRATTRLMHVVAWLLAWRAMDAGEIGSGERELRAHRLTGSDRSDLELVATLPEAARRIIAMTLDLHARVARLDTEMGRAASSISPAHGLVDRLRAAF